MNKRILKIEKLSEFSSRTGLSPEKNLKASDFGDQDFKSPAGGFQGFPEAQASDSESIIELWFCQKQGFVPYSEKKKTASRQTGREGS